MRPVPPQSRHAPPADRPVRPARGRFFRRIFTRLALLSFLGMMAIWWLTWLVTHAWVIRDTMAQLRHSARIVQWTIRNGWPFPSDESLRSACRELRGRCGLRVTVIDPAGVVLADSDAAIAAMENHAGRPEVAAALSGQMGESRRTSASVGRPFIYVALPIQVEGKTVAVARIAAPAEDLERREAALRRWIVLVPLAVVPLALLTAWYLSRTLAAPIQRVGTWAGRLATGDLETRLDDLADDEIGQVAEALNRMRAHLAAHIREVRQQQQDLEVAIGSLEEGVIAVDPAGIVLSANPASRRILGLEDPLIGSSLDRHLAGHALEPFWKEVQASVRTEAARVLTIDRGGTSLTVEVSAVRIGMPDTRIGWVLCVRDITPLVRSVVMKTEFVANASHELRTPVAAIRAALDTLCRPDLDDDERGRFLTVIDRNVERLQNLTEDLMALNRVEAASPQLTFTRFAPCRLLEGLESLFAAAVRAKRATFSVHCEVDQIETDSRWLELILKNLLDNAVKFIGDGGRIDVRCHAGNGDVVFEVEDDGCGIPAHDLDRVFERFYQVDKSRGARLGGTGLGLAIVKHAVQGLGGEVRIASRLGHGTTVTFTLPRQP